jgi:ABC-type branched-subunit amino acid transport system ATPase component/branched-subunit amino acid ABC-type transport system permease component
VLPFIIAGLTTGSVYALAGVGLVLTYKTSGVFNFAHGALATVSAYVFYTLHVQHGMPWVPAAVICVLGIGPLLGLGLEIIVRPLAKSGLSVRVVSTVGVLLIIQSLAVIIYGTSVTRIVPPFLPTQTFHIGTTPVTMDRVIVFAVGAVATAALYIYFRVARTGVAMRAVVGDPDLLDIAGTSPVTVRRWAWVIGATFAAASGVLLVPYITLDATTLTFLVVAAFGAAAVGSFSSLPGTYIGGLAIGIGAALATKYFTTGVFSGLPSSLPFLVLFVVVLVSPRRRLAERAPAVPRSRTAWTAPWQVQGVFCLAALAFLLFVPSFAGFHLGDWTRFLALTVLFLSLGLLVRTSGQVSLCHASFMAIGVCAFSHLAVDHGWPWFAAFLGACVIAVPIGALLAIPAIRLSGLFLALATFGFGILLEYMFYPQSYMFGSLGLGVTVPMPKWEAIGLTGSDESYYYFCLVILVVVTGLIVAMTRGRLGRLLRALADSSVGLATSGTSINVTRVLVFCISAFIAAGAGVLEAGAIGQATAQSYPPLNSLLFFVLAVIGLGGAPWYAFGGAAGISIITSYISNANTNSWLSVPSAGRVEPGSLRVEDLRVTFGGLVAVDGATIDAPTGRITGLIGPNGAGKTTVFNACSGLNRPGRGKVSLDGADLLRMGTPGRARRGMGRTFQQMELFDSLTVWENVALGLEAMFAGPNVFRHLASSRRAAKRVQAATGDVLRRCDMLELAGRTAGSLSTGQRRLVELARCLAGGSRILLLDEPSSGLDRAETARFGEILRDVVRDRGVGILLVEHDMALVTSVCDYLYVLDFGKPIFEGTVAEVVASPVVQAAYLGGVIPTIDAVEQPQVAEVAPDVPEVASEVVK